MSCESGWRSEIPSDTDALAEASLVWITIYVSLETFERGKEAYLVFLSKIFDVDFLGAEVSRMTKDIGDALLCRLFSLGPR